MFRLGLAFFGQGWWNLVLAGSIDPNLRWRFQIDEVLTCWFFITISNWRSSEALLFWGEEFAEVSSLCAKHAQFYSKVIPSLVLPHDFPMIFLYFSKILHSFSIIFPRRFPEDRPRHRRRWSARRSTPSTWPTWRSASSWTVRTCGLEEAQRVVAVEWIRGWEKLLGFLGPMGPMGNQKMMENWEPTTMGNWIYSRFMIAK